MELLLSSCFESFIPVPKLSFFNPHSQLSSLQFAQTFLHAMGPDGALAIGGMSQCPSECVVVAVGCCWLHVGHMIF